MFFSAPDSNAEQSYREAHTDSSQQVFPLPCLPDAPASIPPVRGHSPGLRYNQMPVEDQNSSRTNDSPLNIFGPRNRRSRSTVGPKRASVWLWPRRTVPRPSPFRPSRNRPSAFLRECIGRLYEISESACRSLGAVQSNFLMERGGSGFDH